jgi:hypothetical protein
MSIFFMIVLAIFEALFIGFVVPNNPQFVFESCLITIFVASLIIGRQDRRR